MNSCAGRGAQARGAGRGAQARGAGRGARGMRRGARGAGLQSHTQTNHDVFCRISKYIFKKLQTLRAASRLASIILELFCLITATEKMSFQVLFERWEGFALMKFGWKRIPCF